MEVCPCLPQAALHALGADARHGVQVTTTWATVRSAMTSAPTRRCTSWGYLQNEWKTRKWSLAGRRPPRQATTSWTMRSSAPGPMCVSTHRKSVNLRVSYAGGYRARRRSTRTCTSPSWAESGSASGCRRSERGALAQREPPRPTSTTRSGSVQTNLLVEGFLYQSSTMCSPCATSRTRADGGKIKRALQRFGRHGARLERRGPGGFHPLVRVAGGRDVAAEPLSRARGSERGRRCRPCAGCSARPRSLRLFHRVVQAGANFTADLSGNLHGAMPVQHMAGSGGRDVAVTTPAFCDVNLRPAYDPAYLPSEITLQLYGGVLKYFDAYQKEDSTGAPSAIRVVYGPSLPPQLFAPISVRKSVSDPAAGHESRSPIRRTAFLRDMARVVPGVFRRTAVRSPAPLSAVKRRSRAGLLFVLRTASAEAGNFSASLRESSLSMLRCPLRGR